MKQKLQAFTDFTGSLFSHEIRYLASVENFEKDENRDIFARIIHNSQHPGAPRPFDQDIDKRTYSYLKKWMERKLDSINIDFYYRWLGEIDLQIMNDRIPPEQENILISKLKNYESHDYYFIKFYEILQNYRYYLLIRLRHKNYEIVNNFLEKHKEHYLYLKEINQKIHEATVDIIQVYTLKSQGSDSWESWLKQVFYDDHIDGYNRYLAFIRLTFMYTATGKHIRLKALFEDFDKILDKGEFYSKRILANYYSNRALLHARLNENNLAEKYGYQSIRQITDDYIHYLNVLVSILLRNGKARDALKLMQTATPTIKYTKSYHNRIGFATYYMRCLYALGEAKKASSYAETFLDVNKTEIMEHRRWHFFFVNYLHVLSVLENYNRIIQLVRRFQLLEKESDYLKRHTSSLPSVYWHFHLALYQEGKISIVAFGEKLLLSGKEIMKTDASDKLFPNLIEELEPFMPDFFRKLKARLI